MKHVLLITAVALLLTTAAAAESIVMPSATTGPYTIDATRTLAAKTVEGVVLDQINLTLHGFTNGSTSDKVSILSGRWTAEGDSGTAGFYLVGADDEWTDYILSTGKIAGGSYVNLNASTGKLPDGTDTYRLAAAGSALPGIYYEFGSNWNTTTTSKMWAVGSTVAVLYVTQDTDMVSLVGTTYISNSGAAVEQTITLGQVPEPGALVLLASGLIGLACHAWRKRK